MYQCADTISTARGRADSRAERAPRLGVAVVVEGVHRRPVAEERSRRHEVSIARSRPSSAAPGRDRREARPLVIVLIGVRGWRTREASHGGSVEPSSKRAVGGNAGPDGANRRAEPFRATSAPEASVRRAATVAASPASHRRRLADLRHRGDRGHRGDLPQRRRGCRDQRHRDRRQGRAVDERHRSAGPRWGRPGRELCRLVVGDRAHRLAAHTGADHLAALASSA